jgi:hypothetical protein
MDDDADFLYDDEQEQEFPSKPLPKNLRKSNPVIGGLEGLRSMRLESETRPASSSSSVFAIKGIGGIKKNNSQAYHAPIKKIVSLPSSTTAATSDDTSRHKEDNAKMFLETIEKITSSFFAGMEESNKRAQRITEIAVSKLGTGDGYSTVRKICEEGEQQVDKLGKIVIDPSIEEDIGTLDDGSTVYRSFKHLLFSLPTAAKSSGKL